MVIPLNFVAGAVVGAVSTYIYKDDSAKEWLRETGGKLKEGRNSFMASFKKKDNDDSAETISDADKVEAAEGISTDSSEKPTVATA